MLSQLTSLLGLVPTKSAPDGGKDAPPDADFAKFFAEAEDDSPTFQPDPGPLTDADEIDQADPADHPKEIDPDSETGRRDNVDLSQDDLEEARDVNSRGRWLDTDQDMKGTATPGEFQPDVPTKQTDGWLQRAEELLPKRGPIDGQPSIDPYAEQEPGFGSSTVLDGPNARGWIEGTSSDRSHAPGAVTGALDHSRIDDPTRDLKRAEAQGPEAPHLVQASETDVKKLEAAARVLGLAVPASPAFSQSAMRTDPADRVRADQGPTDPKTNQEMAKPVSDPVSSDIPVFRFGLSQPAREETWPRSVEPPVSMSNRDVMSAGQDARGTSATIGLTAAGPEGLVEGAFRAREHSVLPSTPRMSEDRPQGFAPEQLAAGLRGSAPSGETVTVQPKTVEAGVDPHATLQRFNDLLVAAKSATDTAGKPGQADTVPRSPLESADVFRQWMKPEGGAVSAQIVPAASDGRGPALTFHDVRPGLNGNALPLAERSGQGLAEPNELSVATRDMTLAGTRPESVNQPLVTSAADGLIQDQSRNDPHPLPRHDRLVMENMTQLRSDVRAEAAGSVDAVKVVTPALAGFPVPGTSARVTSPFLDDVVEDLLPQDSQPVSGAPGVQSSPVQTAAMPQAIHRTDAAAILRQVSDGMARLGEGSVEIRLSPEELGQVRMQMMPTDGGMTVHITADRPETLDLMRRHIDQLARDLADAGYESASFSFGEGGEGGQESSARHDRPDKAPHDDTPAAKPRNAAAASDGLDLRF